PDPNVERALDTLRQWDYDLSNDSVAAAIYQIWVNFLHTNVFSLYVPEAARGIFGQGSRAVLTDLLRSMGSGRDEIVLQSAQQAVDRLTQLLGDDMSQWQWGRLHHMTYQHALVAARPELEELLNVGPLPIGGDGFTVHNTGYRLSDFNQTGGASYREVID